MVPYGPRSDEKCSWIDIYKRVMVPCLVRDGPNIYLNVDTNPPIYLSSLDSKMKQVFLYLQKVRSI